MKEAVNANIGGRAFVVDKDAYRRLTAYLADVGSRLEGDAETMADIENRLAEILTEIRTSPAMSVSLAMVEQAMARMGRPEDFGSVRDGARCEGAEEPGRDFRRIRRSRKNRSIAGVCGGLAEFFGIDATILRLVTLMLILFGGLSIWVYVILWIVIPEAEA